tara:strand:- start:913 stop:1572 length:660 start_codon:yes stop_codon:yes gene_type:complete
MKQEMKKRINTGIFLLLLLLLMFLNKIIYLYMIIILLSFSFIEFSKIIKKIFKTEYIKQFFANFSFAIYLFFLMLTFIVGINDIHFKIILFIIILICISSDIGGIIFGKVFKGPKLTKISPNKTLSGSAGSFILSILVSLFLLNYTFKTEIIENVILGVIISFSVQIGDLFISYLKRKSFLKNTGNILPGHGGILDRIDGILLGLPIGLIYILVMIFTV